MAEHESGINPDCYTFQRRPIELVFYEEYDNPDLAIEYEKKIKGWTRKKKEALINGNRDILPSLSECRNSTSHKFYKK